MSAGAVRPPSPATLPLAPPSSHGHLRLVGHADVTVLLPSPPGTSYCTPRPCSRTHHRPGASTESLPHRRFRVRPDPAADHRGTSALTTCRRRPALGPGGRAARPDTATHRTSQAITQPGGRCSADPGLPPALISVAGPPRATAGAPQVRLDGYTLPLQSGVDTDDIFQAPGGWQWRVGDDDIVNRAQRREFASSSARSRISTRCGPKSCRPPGSSPPAASTSFVPGRAPRPHSDAFAVGEPPADRSRLCSLGDCRAIGDGHGHARRPLQKRSEAAAGGLLRRSGSGTNGSSCCAWPCVFRCCAGRRPGGGLDLPLGKQPCGSVIPAVRQCWARRTHPPGRSPGGTARLTRSWMLSAARSAATVTSCAGHCSSTRPSAIRPARSGDESSPGRVAETGGGDEVHLYLPRGG